jgi:hypothetical protein
MVSIRKLKSGAAGAVLALTCLAPAAALAQDTGSAAAQPGGKAWDFTVMPYLFAPSINGDASLGTVDINVDVDPSTVFENLEGAFLGRVDAKHESGWGFYIDYSMMKLGRGMSLPAGLGTILADIDQQVMDVAATYRVMEGRDTVDVYGGIRYWDLGLEIVAPGPLGVDRDENWVDPMIGLRWERGLSDDWRAIALGDIGGFGVSSDFAWQAAVGGAYDGWKNVSLVFMYRATGVDYDTGTAGTSSYFKYDTITSGPLIGAAFRF